MPLNDITRTEQRIFLLRYVPYEYLYYESSHSTQLCEGSHLTMKNAVPKHICLPQY